MTDREHRLSLKLPWTTLMKVVAVLVFVWLARELAWLAMLLIIAMIIAVGLAPIVAWLEDRRWPRWLAAASVVTVLVALILGFLVLTWSSLERQGTDLTARLQQVEHEIQARVPETVMTVFRSAGSQQSIAFPVLSAMTRSLLSFATAFVLAWILVLYLLIEAEMTYAWVRGFVPAARRAKFDQTAVRAREAAYGYVVGNVVTSVCAATYVFIWLALLHVPAALLLALLAFIFDFVPVLGFFFACGPAVAMASTISPMHGLAMIPIYLAYHFIENYIIGPRVYGTRLRLSNVAVLIAFAVGAELGGVAGALIVLPIAAIYPAVERIWLRGPLGDDVVAEHNRLRLQRP